MKNKNTPKIVASLVICLALVLSVFMPCAGINFSVSAAPSYYPSLTLKDKAELLNEYAKPSVSISTSGFSDAFAPSFSGSVASGAPKISSVTAIVEPDDSIAIQGEGFTNCSVWIYGINATTGAGEVVGAKIVNCTEGTVTAIIPYTFAKGMYLVWVQNASGISYPVRVNNAEITWTSESKVKPGGSFNIYGKNLTIGGSEELNATNVYLTKGSKYYKLTTTDVDPYRVTVTVPSNLAKGDYKVWVHNGSGRDYGWSSSLDITVDINAEKIWSGKNVYVNGYTADAIQQAIFSASDYDTIILPKGNYYIDKPISISGKPYSDQRYSKAVRFVGEGSLGDVKIIENFGTDNRPRAMFDISKLPTEFNNIVFEDNIQNYINNPSLKPTYYLAIDPWSNEKDVKDWNAKNPNQTPITDYANTYFRLYNCKFIRHRFSPYGLAADNASAQEKAEYTAADYRYNNLNGSDYYTVGKGAGNYFVAGGGNGMCVYASGPNDVEITNCYFECDGGLELRECSGVRVHNNEVCGTAVMLGDNGSLFTFTTSCDNIDVSNNNVYGRDKKTDPDGIFERGDQGLCRIVVLQLPNGSATNSYIANNLFDRVGNNCSNSGELIMYEHLSQYFMDKPSSVSSDGKTLSFTNVDWEEAVDPMTGDPTNRINFYMLQWDSNGNKVAYQHPHEHYGRMNPAYVVVIDGKGQSQYRKILSTTSNSITVDRSWDIVPDQTSTITVLYAIVNAVVYKNTMINSEEFYETYNASAAIQAYATMLDYVVDSNDVRNLQTGFYCNSHFNAQKLPGTITGNGTHFANISSEGFNWFEDTIITNNKIHNVRNGIDAYLCFDADNDDFGDANYYPAISHNVVFRRNDISKARYAYTYWEHNGQMVNALEGIGADAIAIGTWPRAYTLWGYTRIVPNNDWIWNTIVEHNNISNVASSYISLRHHQSNTIIRENNCDNLTRLEDIVNYELPVGTSIYSGVPYPTETNKVIAYNDYGTKEVGMKGSAYVRNTIDEFENGNFTQGLKYWTDRAGDVTAADRATVVIHNGSNALEIKNHTKGVKSAYFRLPEFESGDEIALVYNWSGSDKFEVTLSGLGLSDVCSVRKDLSKSDWNTSITNVTKITDDISGNEASVSISIKPNDVGTTYFDNFRIVKVDSATGTYQDIDGTVCYMYDGSVYGGSEAEGMKPANTGDIYNYVATNFLKNADFSQGFKFWTAEDGVSSPSAYASISNGALNFTNIPSNKGIMSAPFTVPQEYHGTVPAVAVTYSTNRTTTAILYKNGVAVGNATTSTLKNPTQWMFDFGLQNAWDSNAVYNLAFVHTRTSASTYNISDIRVFGKNGTVYTNIENGDKYNVSSETLVDLSETAGLKNPDFSDELKYWNGSNATVTDGVLKLYKNNGNATATSYNFTLPTIEANAKFAVMFDYKTSAANTTVTVNANSSSVGTFSCESTSNAWKTGIITGLTHSAGNKYNIAISVPKKNESEFDNFRIVVLKDNIYTDIKTGEIYYADPNYDLTEKVVKLSNTDGNRHKDLLATPTLMNGDFSMGLQFWTGNPHYNGEGLPITECATVADGVLSITTSKDWEGISTVPFKLPNAAVGRKFVIKVDVFAENPKEASIRLYDRYKTDGEGTLGWSNITSTNGQWVTLTMIPDSQTITDPNQEYRFEVTKEKASILKIRNLKVYYLDQGDGSLVNLDGSPVDKVYGDVNSDGFVNLADLVRLKKYLAGIEDSICCAAANVNKDSDILVNANDIAQLKRYLLGRIKQF